MAANIDTEAFRLALMQFERSMRTIGAAGMMLTALREKAAVFRNYQQMHLEKAETEGAAVVLNAGRLAKAAVNGQHAEDLEKIIRFIETGRS